MKTLAQLLQAAASAAGEYDEDVLQEFAVPLAIVGVEEMEPGRYMLELDNPYGDNVTLVVGVKLPIIPAD
jgi:hypothetical protein